MQFFHCTVFFRWNWPLISVCKFNTFFKIFMSAKIFTCIFINVLFLQLEKNEWKQNWMWYCGMHWYTLKTAGSFLTLFLVNYICTNYWLWITPFAVKITLFMVIFWPRFQRWCIVDSGIFESVGFCFCFCFCFCFFFETSLQYSKRSRKEIVWHWLLGTHSSSSL